MVIDVTNFEVVENNDGKKNILISISVILR